MRPRDAAQLERENEIVRDAVSKLVKATATLQRGDVISYTIMEQITGILRYPVPLSRERGELWDFMVKHLRKRFRNERSIELVCIEDVGYKLATVTEQVFEQTHRDREMAARRMFRRKRLLDVIPTSELTLNQQIARANASEACRRTRNFINAQKRDLDRIANQPSRANEDAALIAARRGAEYFQEQAKLFEERLARREAEGRNKSQES